MQVNGNPRFAYGFLEGSSPTSSQTISRRNSINSVFNYSYDYRYNFDASFTYDGTTSFGTKNKYSPFYSIGASWNLHKEKFLTESDVVDLLRLRGNYGVTGNQNFSSFTSLSTYQYTLDYNYLGQGLRIINLGNEDLEWQNTYSTSLGIDATFFKNRINVQLNAYQNITDPLVVGIELPPSSSLNSYPVNVGKLTVRGTDFTLRYSPIYNLKDKKMLSFGLTMAHKTQIYSGFDNKLQGLNETLRNSNSLIRYLDGGDPDDIWSVRSLGIDPANGREIFLKKDGSYSYEYDYKDQVVVGNVRPKIEGVFSANLTYKNFNAGLNFRYIHSQDIFNNALFDKVENINMSTLLASNQD